MRNRKSFLTLGIMVLVLFLGVGYAVVSSVYLNIGGTASVDNHDLNVEITNAISTSTIKNKVVDFSHVLSNKNLTSNFTLNGMELNETVSITYTVTNREKDIDATLTLIDGVELTNSNNDYFEADFEIIDDHTDLANNDKTMIVLVTVKLIKTPVSEEGGSTTVGVSFNAIPSKATVDLGGVTFNPDNVSDYTLKVTSMDNTSEFWGYKSKIKTITMEDEINIPIGINEEHVWDVSESGNEKVMAFIIPNSEDSTLYDLYIQGDGGIYANSNSSCLFCLFTNLESIDLDVLNTSYVTDMSTMFSGIKVSSLDLDNFDTSKVTNMCGMFSHTSNLSSLDVSSFNTSSVTDMSAMFLNTGSQSTEFTLNLGSEFNTSNVTDMQNMFFRTGYKSTKFTLDLGKLFYTNNVTDMNSMFCYTGYTNPKFTLNLGSNFNTSKVTNMAGMFDHVGYSSTIFTLDLGNKFDTSNVTEMYQMFDNAGYSSSLFRVDCRSWNVDKVGYVHSFNTNVESKVLAPAKFNS